jgi:hypothetical protein
VIVVDHPKYGRRYLTPTAADAYVVTPADQYDGRSWRVIGTIRPRSAGRRAYRQSTTTTTTTETS